MYWSPAKLVIFVSLVVATVVDVTAVTCVTETPCSCHLPDGSFYDLSKVTSSPLSGEDKKYAFSFMPCKNVKMRLGYEPTPPKTEITACYNNTGVSLCAGYDKGLPFSLGDTTETKWNVLEKGGAELVLTHGTNTTRITLICCPTCVSEITLNEQSAGKFHFVLQSPHSCKLESPPEGISTGSVLVILLFVFSGIYLLVGALVLRFFRGAIGWELIPNYDFWSDLPALVRDGVAFTFSGCSADSYDRI